MRRKEMWNTWSEENWVKSKLCKHYSALWNFADKYMVIQVLYEARFQDHHARLENSVGKSKVFLVNNLIFLFRFFLCCGLLTIAWNAHNFSCDQTFLKQAVNLFVIVQNNF